MVSCLSVTREWLKNSISNWRIACGTRYGLCFTCSTDFHKKLFIVGECRSRAVLGYKKQNVQAHLKYNHGPNSRLALKKSISNSRQKRGKRLDMGFVKLAFYPAHQTGPTLRLDRLKNYLWFVIATRQHWKNKWSARIWRTITLEMS